MEAVKCPICNRKNCGAYRIITVGDFKNKDLLLKIIHKRYSKIGAK